MNLNIPHVHLFPPPFVSVASECSVIAHFYAKTFICKRQISLICEREMLHGKKGTNKKVFVLLFKVNRCFVETTFCVIFFLFVQLQDNRKLTFQLQT